MPQNGQTANHVTFLINKLLFHSLSFSFVKKRAICSSSMLKSGTYYIILYLSGNFPSTLSEAILMFNQNVPQKCLLVKGIHAGAAFLKGLLAPMVPEFLVG